VKASAITELGFYWCWNLPALRWCGDGERWHVVEVIRYREATLSILTAGSDVECDVVDVPDTVEFLGPIVPPLLTI
jgi:hypothetical protein